MSDRTAAASQAHRLWDAGRVQFSCLHQKAPPRSGLQSLRSVLLLALPTGEPLGAAALASSSFTTKSSPSPTLPQVAPTRLPGDSCVSFGSWAITTANPLTLSETGLTLHDNSLQSHPPPSPCKDADSTTCAPPATEKCQTYCSCQHCRPRAGSFVASCDSQTEATRIHPERACAHKVGNVWTVLAGTAEQDIHHEQKTLIHLPKVGDRETSGRQHGDSGFTIPTFASTLAQLVRRIEYVIPNRLHLLTSKPQSLP